KEVVHQLEDQLGVQNEQAGATQRAQLHQIQAGRDVKRMDVFAKLENLDAARGNVRIAPQQIEQADAGVAGETFVDHFQGRHAAPDDPVLTGQVIASDAGIIDVVLRIDIAVVDAVEERVNLVLG